MRLKESVCIQQVVLDLRKEIIEEGQMLSLMDEARWAPDGGNLTTELPHVVRSYLGRSGCGNEGVRLHLMTYGVPEWVEVASKMAPLSRMTNVVNILCREDTDSNLIERVRKVNESTETVSCGLVLDNRYSVSSVLGRIVSSKLEKSTRIFFEGQEVRIASNFY